MRTSKPQLLRPAQGPSSGGCSGLLPNHARYDQSGNIGSLGGSWVPSGTQTPFVTQDLESSVAAVYPGNRWNGANYDTAGNVTGVPTGGQSFTYTGEGLLRTATIGTAPAIVTQYSYDGLGRRVQKVVGTPTVTTTFAVDASGTVSAE